MVANMREKKDKQRKTKEQVEALVVAVRTILKQPEKNAQRDPGEKGWACYYCGKEGHRQWDCPQMSKPPPAPCLVWKGPQWRRDCPQRHRFQGSDSQDNQDWRCPEVSTQAPILIIGSIKDRNGRDLTEAEDIKKRWQEYTEELYKKKSSRPR